LAEILTEAVLSPLPAALSETSDMEAWLAAREAGGDVYLVRGRGSAPLGLFFLKPDGPGTVFLGYLFEEAAWRQGHASEVVQGAVAAIGPCPGLVLRASVVPSNGASIRVLEKAGFDRDPAADADGTAGFVLRL
jgi:RimJ/RimL family protein N-acetyltransferase